MINYQCKCCDSTICKEYIKSCDYNYKIDNKEFIYSKCLSCNNIFLNNIPDNLHKYYEKNYLPYQIKNSYADEKINNNRVQLILSLNKKKILEISPGNGKISKKLKDLNCDVTVFDINDISFDELKKKGVKTFKINFMNLI